MRNFRHDVGAEVDQTGCLRSSSARKGNRGWRAEDSALTGRRARAAELYGARHVRVSGDVGSTTPRDFYARATQHSRPEAGGNRSRAGRAGRQRGSCAPARMVSCGACRGRALRYRNAPPSIASLAGISDVASCLRRAPAADIPAPPRRRIACRRISGGTTSRTRRLRRAHRPRLLRLDLVSRRCSQALRMNA